MSNDSTECIQRWVTEGPLGVTAVICLGIALAAVFAVLSWRGRGATGGAWAWIFWGLRTAALIVVLWMLLGPAWVSEYRTTTRQTVALVVDGSGSMGVADSPDTPDMARWSLAPTSQSEAPSLLVACDRAGVAIRAAAARCCRLREAIRAHAPPKELRRLAEEIDPPVQHAVDLLDRSLDKGGLDKALQAHATSILARMQGDLHRHLLTLGTSTDDDRLADDMFDVLQAIENDLVDIQHRLDRLGYDLVAAGRQTQGDVAPSRGALTRREYVGETLDALEQGTLRELRDQFQVKRFQFDRLMSPVLNDQRWTEVLNATAARAAAKKDDTPTASPSTDISTALAQLGDVSNSGKIRTAILLSDGRHNSPGSRAPEEVAAALGGMVVHVVPIGNSEPVRDVFLHRVGAPKAVAKGDSIVIDVIVTATKCAGETTKLVLRQGDKLVEERRLAFDTDRLDHRLSFQVPANEAGRREFELSIEALPNEAATTNNKATVAVEVMSDKLTVLLADRISRWEYRYLEQLFRRDKHIEFDRLLFSPTVLGTGAREASGALPRDVDAWSRYNVVILGDLDTQQLDRQSQEALAESIRQRGNNLIVIAGRENMPQRYVDQPLMDLLPVERGGAPAAEDGLRLSLTEAGKIQPVMMIASSADESLRIWQRLFQWRPTYSLSEYCRPKPTAETWLCAGAPEVNVSVSSAPGQQPDRAMLSWHYVGAGKVVYLASPTTYQLRFRGGDRHHHRFWGQLLRWVTARDRAVGTDTVRIATDRDSYRVGEGVDVVVRLKDSSGIAIQGATLGAVARTRDGDAASPRAAGETAATISLVADERVPGQYHGQILGLPRGLYQIEPAGEAIAKLLAGASQAKLPVTLVTVEPADSLEMVNTQCNRPLLERIAELTGGQVVPPTAIAEILRLSNVAPEVSQRVESRTSLEPMERVVDCVRLRLRRMGRSKTTGIGVKGRNFILRGARERKRSRR